MAFRAKPWVMASIILFVLQLGIIMVMGEPQVPCYFIFGDSLFDNGNNNGLETLAKVNYSPYGIDFPEGATGRFTNGRTVVDIIGELLGFSNYTPPFATANDRNILRGVNYASGGAGILAETGQELGERISLDEQLLHHQTIVSRVTDLQKNIIFTKEYLSKCMYMVGMGSNDYINNYLMPQFFNSSKQYTPTQFARVLIRQYSKQLKTLYKYGARKVALFGLGQIGCTPAEMAIHGTSGSACSVDIDNDTQLFNSRLVSLVDDLNKNLTDAKFIYINITGISTADSSTVGITVVNTPCCSTNSTTGLCVPNQVPCSNRSAYAFWDAFHPTEIVNVIAARRAYSAESPFDAYPIDICHLAQL